ncbi:hypothetical protein NN561_010946 [Cricetulus griseus]
MEPLLGLLLAVRPGVLAGRCMAAWSAPKSCPRTRCCPTLSNHKISEIKNASISGLSLLEKLLRSIRLVAGGHADVCGPCCGVRSWIHAATGGHADVCGLCCRHRVDVHDPSRRQ